MLHQGIPDSEPSLIKVPSLRADDLEVSQFVNIAKSFRSRLVLAWAVVVFIVVAALAWADFALAREFRSSGDWVIHTHEVLRRIGETLSLLTDIENGQRGYCLTSQVEYLESYHIGQSKMQPVLAELVTLTADNPQQQARLARLAPLIHERIALARESVELCENDSPDDEVLEASNQGRTTMDSIRVLIEELKTEEVQLLSQRKQAASVSLVRHQSFNIALLVILAAVSAGIVWMQQRLNRMQQIVKVCAWTNRIEYGGQWVPFDQYLHRRFGLKTSHGMSEDAAEKMRDELSSMGD